MRLPRRPNFRSPRCGGLDPITIGYAVSIGLSILAGYLLKKQIPSPVKDDKPTTLATRGSLSPWYVGIKPVGPVFVWSGWKKEREIRKEKVPGAKGIGGSPESEVYYEPGVHVVGTGPHHALHSIREQGGRVIFQGPITSESHPSGSTIDLGKEGTFRIFWGEVDQPVNSYLGNADRIGITSRWPHFCYVEWNKKRLGTSAIWPLLEYEMERRPSNHSTILPSSQGWYEPVQTLNGPTFSFTSHLSNAVETTGYLEVAGDQTQKIKPRTRVALLGNGLANGDYEVLNATSVLVVIGTSPNGFDVKTPRTRVFLQGGTLGANSAGTMQLYTADKSDGANPAHAIAELLFAPAPLGLGISPDGEVEEWDTNSLDALGEEAEDNNWRGSIGSQDGDDAESILGAWMQDFGTFLTIDSTSGKMRFVPIREPSGTLPNIDAGIFADKPPEITTDHGEFPVTRTIYQFSDREHNFSTMTFSVNDAGQATYEEFESAQRVSINSTTHFATASDLAELRSPEELSHRASHILQVSRAARTLMPGQAVLCDQFEEVLRVIGVKTDPLSEAVEVEVMPDFYGAERTDFVHAVNAGGPETQDPEQDTFAWVEIPEHLSPGQMSLFVPRIRANTAMAGSYIHLSRDDTSYTLWGTETSIQTGGTLDAALAASGPVYLAQGPVYTEIGDDNGTIQDLSADLTNWGLGRQLAIIVSSAGVEVCFVQKATIVSATQRRLDGLLRARYDTRRLSHPSGAVVYVVNAQSLSAIQDALLEPGEDLFVKSQGFASTGGIDLASVPPFGELLRGKGLVPIDPDYLHVRAPYRGAPCYATGDDVTVAVALSTATSLSTGAGYQSAGAAVGEPEIPGTVVFELRTLADAIVDTRSSSALEQTWTNSQLVSALGSEVGFKVRCYHAAGGYVSGHTEITVTKV